MTLDGLRKLMLDDLGRHLERQAPRSAGTSIGRHFDRQATEKRNDALTPVVPLVIGQGVERMTDGYLAGVERRAEPNGTPCETGFGLSPARRSGCPLGQEVREEGEGDVRHHDDRLDLPGRPRDLRRGHGPGRPHPAAARLDVPDGRAILTDGQEENKELSDSLSHLLVVGFYLVSLGVICFAIKIQGTPADVRTALELLSTKVGTVLVVLGAMHFLILAVFAKVRKGHRRPGGNDERAAPIVRDHDAHDLAARRTC